jgi:hypothetical protein
MTRQQPIRQYTAGKPRQVDPLLQGIDWIELRRYWRAQRLDCARCGRPIDYSQNADPRNKLDVGHIVDRQQAKALGWTRQQINCIGNTQPEHARCGRSAGARQGNTRRRATRVTTRPTEADEW